MTQYLDSHQKVLQDAYNEFIKELNAEEGEITKQVGTIVSILLPLTSLFFASEKFLDDISSADFAMGGIMIASFIVALLSSTWQVFVNKRFWENRAEIVSNAIDEFLNADFNDDEAKEAAFLDDLFARALPAVTSNDVPIRVAYASLALGLVTLGVLIFTTFFF